jgi:predicted amidohydrolase YtcJ
MAFYRNLTILSATVAALFALVASFMLGEKAPTSALYCTSDIVSGLITTLSTSLPRAHCFRVENGIFTEVLDFVPTDQQFTTLDGHVFPGIIESHGHILQYGEMLESVSLYGATSMQEVKSRIKEWLARHKGEGYGTRDKWIRGIGWDQAYFGGVMPTAVWNIYNECNTLI